MSGLHEVQDKYFHARALSEMAPFLPPEKRDEILTEALTSAKQIQDEEYCTRALIFVLRHLPPEQQSSILAEILTLIGKLPEKDALGLGILSREHAIYAIAQYLPKHLLAKALEIAMNISDPDPHCWSLVSLAPYLPSDLVDKALAAIKHLEGKYRIWCIEGFAPYLSRVHLLEVLTIAKEIRDNVLIIKKELGNKYKEFYCKTLVTSAQNWSEAVATVREVRDNAVRAEMIAIIAQQLPLKQRQKLIEEALATVRSIREVDKRVHAMASVASYLSPEQKGEILTEALMIAH